MLKLRVIPTLLWKDVGLVKGVGFNSWRRVGSVMPAIKVYDTREVDELILVDISATNSNREPDYESIGEFSAECFVPLTVGGGITSLDQITRLLREGADKVAINTCVYSDSNLVKQAVNRFGSQCIVASIDAKKIAHGEYECYSHSGTKPTGKEVCEWARHVESLGAGEILLTSIDRDGTLEGYDLDLIHKVTESVAIPVIASGGAGSYEDFKNAIFQGGASAVAAAAMFHFTEQTPKEAKIYLHSHGIPVRDGNRMVNPY